MTDTLAHSFDCECTDCTANDSAAPQGMDLFRKPRKAVVTVTTTTPQVPSEPIRRLPAGQRVGNGRVRKISEKQERFILKLINERDTTNLHLVTGQTINPTDVPFMGVKGASALIEKLLGLPIRGTDSPVMVINPNIPVASEKQIGFINTLASRKGFELPANINEIDKQSASRMIETLLSLADKPRETISHNTSESVTEGMYTVGARIFKVQAARGSGNLYAKELIDGTFEYVAGAISIVRREGVRMTLTEAMAYGKRTGQCCQCGRTLTVQESITKGIGPICESKF